MPANNVTNVTVTCATTFSVGGTVSGLSGTVILQNNGINSTTISTAGTSSFTFSTKIAQGSNYTVTVSSQPATQTCTVSNSSGIMPASNVTNVTVACVASFSSVGGTVTGLSGTVVLQNNGTDTTTISNNGSFTFLTQIAKGSVYSVSVSTQPTPMVCVVSNGLGTMGSSNVTNVGVTCSTLQASVSNLALSVTGLTEYGITPTTSGIARVITITNNAGTTATGLSVISTGLPNGTSIDATSCGSSLGSGSSCTITVTPGSTATSDVNSNPCSQAATTPVPGTIQVSATGVVAVSINVFVLSYGCIYQGGYVYAFDDTTVTSRSVGGKIATPPNQASASTVIWSANGLGNPQVAQIPYTSDDELPGIDETSTTTTGSPSYSAFTVFFENYYYYYYYYTNPFTSASFSQCNGALDGSCNTANILTFYNQLITNNNSATGASPPFNPSPGPTPITYYAAGLCTQTINSYSDWYLPAICELGYDGTALCGTSVSPILQNMQSNLVNFNSLHLFTLNYWSSTLASANLLQSAYSYFFSVSSPSGAAIQKQILLRVSCTRALT